MCFVAKTCDKRHFGDLHLLLGQIHPDIKAEIFLLVLCLALEGACTDTPSTQGGEGGGTWVKERMGSEPIPLSKQGFGFSSLNTIFSALSMGVGLGVEKRKNPVNVFEYIAKKVELELRHCQPDVKTRLYYNAARYKLVCDAASPMLPASEEASYCVTTIVEKNTH